MKKKVMILFSIMLVVVLSGMLISAITRQNEDKSNKITIVTSFYPMYVLAKNIVGDEPNVEVVNLTEFKSGCLHDYQLTTSDMKKLENADILIMNGGGMESFIENVLEAYPNLPIIDASEGIEYLLSEGHDHEDENGIDVEENAGNDEINIEDSSNSSEYEVIEDNHELEEYNAHVWLNMNYYIKQIQTVQEALAEFDPKNAAVYQDNGTTYQAEVNDVKEQMETALAENQNTKIVIFHDSFAYLAQELGLDVVHTVNMDSESSLSAGEIAEVVDEVNKEQIKILFTEEQYSTSIADNIAKETEASVYVIDSIVSGDMSKDGYISAMKKNLEVLKQALSVD